VIVEEEFGCEGWFGFGNGVALHRGAISSRGEVLGCHICPKAQTCWQKHRERLRQIVPGLMEIEDELEAKGITGAAFLPAYAARIEELGGGKNAVPPEVSAMGGNMEDGVSVAAGGMPKDRGDWTMRYPFRSH